MIVAGFTACDKLLPKAPDNTETLDGPIEGLSPEQLDRFLRGDAAFAEVFHTGNGLGPIFVSTSCASCHPSDGKGHPFSSLVRFGQNDSLGNTFLAQGGPQLQHRAIPGHTPESLPSNAPHSLFLPPSNAGLGLLAALTDLQILGFADPMDADGDGISGRPNYIAPPVFFVPTFIHQYNNGKFIGRFGRKAAAIDLLIQTVNAYNQDMGITSEFLNTDPYNPASGSGPGDGVPDPEISRTTIDDLVFYLRTIKPPTPRNQGDTEITAGKNLFVQIKCGKCHIPSWTTGVSDIQALSNITFYPYTDLLLHDMGPGLDDGYTEGGAMTSEWRTPPLWGLGLSPNSQGGEYFLMHDGRAHTLRDAILLHGGEGQDSKNLFQLLTEEEQEQLLKFLESL
ncbi:MAG: thiol oxidoreductase [Bacteroidia bacterium]|nr:thiol oxidoreductase [Bacteroidia bacterium]